MRVIWFFESVVSTTSPFASRLKVSVPMSGLVSCVTSPNALRR
jgi:hypothetical protein